MAEPPTTITTVNGRRCTRVRRTSTLLAGTTSTSPATSTAAPGTQTTAAPATTVPPLSSTEAAPVPAPAAPSSSASSLQLDASQPAQSAAVSAEPSQPSSPSPPSTKLAVATTATGLAVFSSDASSSSFATSAALNALPSSTIPTTSTAHTATSDTVTAAISVISSSAVTSPQSTIASDSSFPTIAGGGTEGAGSEGAGSTSNSGNSSGHGSRLPPGAVAGIVIGVLFGIVAVVALVLFCLKRRKDGEGQGEKSAGDGDLAGLQARPRSGFAAKWAALTAGIVAKAGPKPSNNHGLARRPPESPAFEPASRSSYGSGGSTRHLRSASAPAKPRATRFAGLVALKQRLHQPRKVIAERRGRAVSTDSIPSFYSPTPPQLEDLPESLNPFRDPVPTHYHVTNPDALSPTVQTPKSVMPGSNVDQNRGPLTPGSAGWRQPTWQFGFPSNNQPEDPFLDPQMRTSAGPTSYPRRSSVAYPPIARVALHARTQSNGARALSQARSSWYSEDSGYVSPSHPSAHILPLRPPKSNPFADKYASQLAAARPQETDTASIYILPSNSVDSVESPPGPIPLPSARASGVTLLSVQPPEPLATTSTYRSSWLSPGASLAMSSDPSTRSSAASSRDGGRRTAASRSTRGKSDPFDLDRPEILAINYDPGKTPEMSRQSNGSDWWKAVVDEGTGSGSDYDSPPSKQQRGYAYGMAP